MSERESLGMSKKSLGNLGDLANFESFRKFATLGNHKPSMAVDSYMGIDQVNDAPIEFVRRNQ